MGRFEIGRADEATHPDALRGALAEFIATFLFVFAGVGSAIAYGKISGPTGGELTPAGLVAIALAHGIALFVVIAATANISGGHVNPAVTLGLAVEGQITFLRGAFYWIAQLLGSSLAALILKYTTTGEVVPVHALGAKESIISGLVWEVITTFGLVFVVYATAVDIRAKGTVGGIAPIAIGFTVLGNILAAGPFSGGSMNPARSFGPALVAWNWENHWIYWVGPLVGGALAGWTYGEIFLPSAAPPTHAPIPSDEY